MTGSRAIQNDLGSVGVHHIQHLGYQHTSAYRHRFTRLQIHLYLISLAECANGFNQRIALVIGPANMMAATKIDPLHIR